MKGLGGMGLAQEVTEQQYCNNDVYYALVALLMTNSSLSHDMT